MTQIIEVTSIEALSELKQQYMDLTTAPLDGMWMAGFVPMARHFGFFESDQLIGFFCINDEDYLLQFHVTPERQEQTSLLFNTLLSQEEPLIGKIKGAFVSTAEPYYLTLCLDSFTQFKSHSLMYEKTEPKKQVVSQKTKVQMTVIKSEQLSAAVEFAKTAIGAPEEWLTGYFSNLINRQELHGYWQDGCLVATGECRGFDQYQTEYADLGFIVAQSHREQGLGTEVFKYLVTLAETKGLQPICSTEKTNIGAQKAITRSGLFAGNRIIQFDL